MLSRAARRVLAARVAVPVSASLAAVRVRATMAAAAAAGAGDAPARGLATAPAAAGGGAGTRVESDTMGKIDVPNDVYWGAQTQRSLENFKIGGPAARMPIEIIRGEPPPRTAADPPEPRRGGENLTRPAAPPHPTHPSQRSAS